MKNILGAALLATLSPAFLSAESYATVIKIKPNYQTKTISEPQRPWHLDGPQWFCQRLVRGLRQVH